MTTQELLQELQLKIATGEVTCDELMRSLRLSHEPAALLPVSPAVEGAHLTITKTLYMIGAGIFSVGIFIFMAQVWDDIGAFLRISVTFGLGSLMALLGSLLLKTKPESSLGTVFHFIGGILIPGGAVVVLQETNLDSTWLFALIFTAIAFAYTALAVVQKNTILTFFAIAHATIAAYLVTFALLDPALGPESLEIIFQYLTMTIGVSYIVLSRAFVGARNRKLVGVLQFFGVAGLLGAGFFRMVDSKVWEMAYILIVLSALAVSAYMKSRIILLMSTLFLVGYVTYITAAHFADSLGWPVALVLLGSLFIGLGYACIAINNTYIKSATDPKST